MLVAEELFLLLRTDDGKTESGSSYPEYGLAAALVTDLALSGAVEIQEDKRNPRVHLVSPPPQFDHPVLNWGVEAMSRKDGKKVEGIITSGSFNPTDEVAAALANAGIIEIQERKMLGLMPSRYPVLNDAPERELRQHLASVIAGQQPPRVVDGVLLTILQAVSNAHVVLRDETGGLGQRQLRKRVEEISEQAGANDQVAASVKRAIDGINMVLFMMHQNMINQTVLK